MVQGLFDLTGRVALVTGGSKGIGKAMARGFATHGADIFICSRNEEELRSAAAEIAAGLDRRVEWMVVDMTKPEQVNRLAQTAMDRFGRVDILVNNAGSNVPQAVDTITDEIWDRILELNLTSIMRLTRALAPQMKERRWGRIIHISSIMALSAREKRGSYAATKAALVGMARASAIDLGPYNVTVNCIAPGPILTDLPRTVLTEEERQSFARHAALGRWGQPEELAGPALLLASEAGSYITGATLVVDGGVLARAV